MQEYIGIKTAMPRTTDGILCRQFENNRKCVEFVGNQPLLPKEDDKAPKPGDVVFYGGFEWIVLGKEQYGILVVASEPIARKMFDTGNLPNWKISSLRKYLNRRFLSKIGDSDCLLSFRSNLVSYCYQTDFGVSDDKVFLLSESLFRKYKSLVPSCLWDAWTITPQMTSYVDVRVVLRSGAFGSTSADSFMNIVPCLLLDPAKFEN